MNEKKDVLCVVLPDGYEDVPVTVIRRCALGNLLDSRDVLIWRQSDYLRVKTDEILYVSADRSYSTVHLVDGRQLTVSFNLAVIQRDLPPEDFIRIHRSYLVNIRHMVSLSGNCVRVGDCSLTVGREYRDAFMERFIVLGVRRGKR